MKRSFKAVVVALVVAGCSSDRSPSATENGASGAGGAPNTDASGASGQTNAGEAPGAGGQMSPDEAAGAAGQTKSGGAAGEAGAPDSAVVNVGAGAASLEIPPGAEPCGIDVVGSVATTSAVAPPAGQKFEGSIYAFTPHGTTFSAPLTIRLPAASKNGVVYTLDDDDDDAWDPVPDVKRSAGEYVLSVDHISYFAELVPDDATPTACGQPSLTTFDGAALALSGDGNSVAGGVVTWDSGYYETTPVFRRSNGKTQSFPNLFAVFSLTSDGTLVGLNTSGNPATAFMAAPDATTLTPLGWSIPWGGTLITNADGRVLAGRMPTTSEPPSSVDPIYEAYRWTESGGLQKLGYLEYPLADGSSQFIAESPPTPSGTGGGLWLSSEVVGISVDGKVLVGNTNDSGSAFFHGSGFVWTQAAGMERLPAAASGTVLAAAAVSGDGSTVVGTVYQSGTSSVAVSGYLYTKAGGVLSIPSFTPLSVNADGSVVAGVSAGVAAIWDVAHGVRTLASILTAAGVDHAALGSFAYDPDSLGSKLRVSISGDGCVVAGSVPKSSAVPASFYDSYAGYRVTLP